MLFSHLFLTPFKAVMANNPDFLWNALPIVISVFALFVSVGALWQNAAHNKKNVLPLYQLSIEDNIDSEDKNRFFSVYVCNNGIGPLIIKKVNFIKDGRSYPSVSDITNVVIGRIPVVRGSSTDEISVYKKDLTGGSVTANSKETLLRIDFDTSADHVYQKTAAKLLREFFSEAEPKVIYEDIYKRKFDQDDKRIRKRWIVAKKRLSSED